MTPLCSFVVSTSINLLSGVGRSGERASRLSRAGPAAREDPGVSEQLHYTALAAVDAPDVTGRGLGSLAEERTQHCHI